MVLGGFHGLQGYKVCNLWQPVATGCCPQKKMVDSNPAAVEVWRLGCLEAWIRYTATPYTKPFCGGRLYQITTADAK